MFFVPADGCDSGETLAERYWSWIPTVLEIPATGLALAPRDALRHALRGVQAGAAHMTALETIWFGWPNLEHATDRLAGLLSHGFPLPTDSHHQTPEGSLLAATIGGAIASYQEAHRHQRHELQPPRAFLRGLLSAAAGICAYDVFGVSGSRSSRWELGAQPLTEFVSAWQTIAFVPADDPTRLRAATKSLLVGCLLRIEDIALLGDDIGPASVDPVMFPSSDHTNTVVPLFRRR